MKILIVSDTHRRDGNLREVIKKVSPIDMLIHGHLYGVTLGTEGIKEEGKSRNADIVMFGHTHKPCLEYWEDMVILNPGSLSYPRQDGRKPSYMIMELDRDGEAHFTVNYIEKDDIIL